MAVVLYTERQFSKEQQTLPGKQIDTWCYRKTKIYIDTSPCNASNQLYFYIVVFTRFRREQVSPPGEADSSIILISAFAETWMEMELQYVLRTSPIWSVQDLNNL